MLQRAASDAYSWWWASHIRTKQSKWLEENLQDMEDKVSSMLRIIENDGDSFAQRAEMYYRRRPELIDHVEDSYRAYRALAERYDHLSKELQSANRTIATVFPDQVQFAIDDDYEDDETRSTTSFASADPRKVYKPPANIPKVPAAMPKKELRSQTMSVSRKAKQLHRTASARPLPPSSGLSREEAIEEIDKLHKEILALQTEKEFVRSVYERCHAKYFGIENQITDLQATISNLQDEFSIGHYIDDNEARKLMAATALKSCRETLVKLLEKQEKSAEGAKVEDQRIKEAYQKFKALRREFLSKHTDVQEIVDEDESDSEDLYGLDMELLREKIWKELDADSKSSITVLQLAERIDELVEKVVNLETAVSSQDALVNRLRSETDGLQTQVKTLEEDKETLMENSEKISIKLKELEEELNKVKNLNRSVKDQNTNLRTHFTEASCSIDHLSERLETVKPEEEVDEDGASVQGAAGAKAEGVDDKDKKTPEEKKDGVSADVLEKLLAAAKEKIDEKRDMSETDSILDNEQDEQRTEEDDVQSNWGFLSVNGLDEREKLLLEEYTTMLKNYKDVRTKLSDVEKKNRDGFFELALQIRELKHAIAVRDDEIRSLRSVNSPQKHQDDNHGGDLSKYKLSNPEASPYPESMTQAPSFLESNLSSLSSPQQPLFDPVSDHQSESRRRMSGLSTPVDAKTHRAKNEMKMKPAESPRPVSALEQKIRSDIDELLEENLEFWLRFSPAVHQIRKFQSSIHDLKMELSKLLDHKKQSGTEKSNQALMSEARPIYNHLREIDTELTLWLENNIVLKDELQARFASLCNIQEELSRIGGSSNSVEGELSEYQAAKFQGELLNMKQESNKVGNELHAGVDRVRGLKDDVEKILTKLDDELGLSASKHRSTSRARIPLRSFLFGVKLKKRQQKASLFSCVSPSLQKQYSDMAAAGKAPL